MTSLVAFAASLCAQRALKGATWADGRVHLEPNAPFDVDEPALALYCEAGKIDAREWQLGGAGLRLRIEMFLPAFAPGGIDNSRSSALAAALFWRQVARALLNADGASIWADLFLRIAGRVQSAETVFEFYEGKDNLRIDMRGQVLTLGESLAEPEFGQPPAGVWVDLIAALRADGAETAMLADLIESAIRGADAPQWRSDAAMLQMAAASAALLGLDPAAVSDIPQAGVVAVEIVVDEALTDV